MAKEYIIPPEGTATMNQQKIASALASDVDYKEKGSFCLQLYALSHI